MKIRNFMFENSIQGIIYILLIVCSPIATAFIELLMHEGGLDLYVSLMISCFVLMYEYVGLFRIPKVCERIWWERLIGLVVAAVIIAYSILNIVFFVKKGNIPKYDLDEYIFTMLLLTYIVIAFLELIKILKAEFPLQTMPHGSMAEYIVSGANKV